MQWYIPGTTLTADPARPEQVCQQFASMFLAGGMILSQVSAVTGVETYTVQNWVKRGFLPAPRNKRYDINQVCRIIHIQMLKRVLPMEKIVGLLAYVNGHLDDSADDLIDDSRLYFMFVQVAAAAPGLQDPDRIHQYILQTLKTYEAPSDDARIRVEKVLRIMLTAWFAARLHEKTEAMVAEM